MTPTAPACRSADGGRLRGAAASPARGSGPPSRTLAWAGARRDVRDAAAALGKDRCRARALRGFGVRPRSWSVRNEARGRSAAARARGASLLHAVLLVREGDWRGLGPAEDDGDAAPALGGVPQRRVGVGRPREDRLADKLDHVRVMGGGEVLRGDPGLRDGDGEALEVGLSKRGHGLSDGGSAGLRTLLQRARPVVVDKVSSFVGHQISIAKRTACVFCLNVR